MSAQDQTHYQYVLRRAAQHITMPWKNGGGATTELAKFPDATGTSTSSFDFIWRLSVATITTSGPFSNFPGYDRHIALLTGPSPTLVHEDKDRQTSIVLEALMPHFFRGEMTTHCEIDGATCRDFNVMTRRGQVTACVEAITAASSTNKTRSLDSDWHLFYVVSGNVLASLADQEQHLNTNDLLILSRDKVGDAVTFKLNLQPDAAHGASTVMHVAIRKL